MKFRKQIRKFFWRGGVGGGGCGVVKLLDLNNAIYCLLVALTNINLVNLELNMLQKFMKFFLIF